MAFCYWHFLSFLFLIFNPIHQNVNQNIIMLYWRILSLFWTCFPAHDTLDWLTDKSHHSAAKHRASTRIFHFTLFLASVLIFPQVFLTPLASSSTVLRHVFLSLPLSRLACLAMSSEGFSSVWPSHPHSRFLICRSIPGGFVRFHNSTVNLVRPENFQHFPQAFINKYLQLGCYIF